MKIFSTIVAPIVLLQAMDNVEWSIPPERLADEDDEHWPIPVDLTGVDTKTDMVFSSTGEEEVTLDIYFPKGRAAKPLPCIVAIHGGGWQVNTKEWFAPHAVYLARAGYVSATINYRKLPDHPVKACVEDAQAAIRWIRANAEELGVDPNKIGALGGSAGGHLAAVLATTSDKQSRVNAAVGFAVGDLGHPGAAHFLEELGLSEDQAQELGAYPHITENASPILLVHGTDDEAVPVIISKDIHKRYQEKGVHSELKLLDGYHHVFYVTPKTFFEAMGYAREFFDKRLANPSD